MAVLITDNATGVLSAGISAAATSIVLNSGQGANFPNPSAPDWFPATLYNAGGTTEIVKCTARTSDTLTVVRGQEGTTASAYLTGDKLDLRLTAAALANKLDKDTGGTVGGPINATGLQVAGDAAATLVAAQTLTNKTLTAPVVAAATTASSIDDGSTTTPFPIGWRDLPVNNQTGNYTLALTDRAKGVRKTPTGTDVVTIPLNSAVAFPVGSIVPILNDGSGTVSIVGASGVTLVFGGGGVTGSRSLAATGIASAWQVAANRWYIFGPGVT